MDSDQEVKDILLTSRDHGMWLNIQRNTFTNWTNQCLLARGLLLHDLRTDLSTGVNLVALVEALTRHRIDGAVSDPSNQYEKLQNITIALEALKMDGLRIVNIDSSAIVAGNMKLILGLIWQLILKYQVGQNSLNKLWLLKWLQAVLPECPPTNLTTSLNDGIILHALLDFCQPGLSPDWKSLDKNNKLENCRSALKLAKQHLDIPLIVRAEDISSPELDELSAITYLSYFIKDGGPGYLTTLDMISAFTGPTTVNNFTSHWTDGRALTNIVLSSGAHVYKEEPDGMELTPLDRLHKAMEAGKQIGVQPLFTPESYLSDPSEHLGMMAYTAQYIWKVGHGTPWQYVPGGQRDVIRNMIKNNPGVIRTVDDGGLHGRGSNGLTTTSTVLSGNQTQNHTLFNVVSTTSSSNDVDYYNTSRGNRFEKRYEYQTTTQSNITNGGSSDLQSPPILNSHTSTINTAATTNFPFSVDSSQHNNVQSRQPMATFRLVNQTAGQSSRVDAPDIDQLKVDVYSSGVILETKVRDAFDPDKFLIETVSPSGRVIKMSGDGHYSAPFDPSEIGRWHVSMSYDGREMEKCAVDVCDPSRVKVMDMRGGFVGKTNKFHVDCSQAGVGDVGVDVTFRGRLIPSNVTKSRTDGIYKVKFTPQHSGPHAVNVHFNRAEIRDADFYTLDQEERQRKAVFMTEITPHEGFVEIKSSCDWEIDYLTGGPFICHVTDSLDIPVYRMEDGTVCGRPELIVDCSRVGPGKVAAEVTYNGMRYPCRVREEAEGLHIYRLRFKPRGPGIYRIWITLDGMPIKGSPFVQEIADLEEPSVFGDGLYRGVLGHPATFTINQKGHPGQVSVTIDGPSKPEQSSLQLQPDNTILATFYPMERGLYLVNVLVDSNHIKGSPFHPLVVDPYKVKVFGGWRLPVIPLVVGREKVLSFDVSEALPGELTAEVQGPRGKIPVTIDAKQDGQHSIIFIPRETGRHNIHVRWGGYPLAHSPYQGEATMGSGHDDSNDVIYPNVRLAPLRVRSPEGSVTSSNTGMNGYPPVTYRMMDEPDTRYYQPQRQKIQVVSQHQTYPNNYNTQPIIRVYDYERHYNNKAPTSPLLSPVSPTSTISTINRSATSSVRTPQKVILSGKGVREAVVRMPAFFKVDGTHTVAGSPSAYLESVRYKIPVSLEMISPNVYRCQYVPINAGAYLLYINWNDKPLKGSPFKVNVRDPVDPSKVVMNFDLKGGIVGKDFEMCVDPRQAGAGQLTAECHDPIGREIPVRMSDNYDGTRSLKVRPTMAGVHRVDVKYDGIHLTGSPFAITIRELIMKTGSVKSWGSGLESGVLSRFEGKFWVETTGAGAGDLKVRVIGPKGAFNVRLNKASGQERVYQCHYDPVEAGLYTVHIQWSGKHVAGSPYAVLLADDQFELQRMQAEFGNAVTTANNSMANRMGSMASLEDSAEVFRRNNSMAYIGNNTGTGTRNSNTGNNNSVRWSGGTGGNYFGQGSVDSSLTGRRFITASGSQMAESSSRDSSVILRDSYGRSRFVVDGKNKMSKKEKKEMKKQQKREKKEQKSKSKKGGKENKINRNNTSNNNNNGGLDLNLTREGSNIKHNDDNNTDDDDTIIDDDNDSLMMQKKDLEHNRNGKLETSGSYQVNGDMLY